VPGHIIHVTVEAALKPFEQARLGSREVDARDPERLESQLPAPLLDFLGKAYSVHPAARGIRLHDHSRSISSNSVSRSLPDEAATAALGAALGHALEPGMNIYLHGDLGAGKTTLVRGLLRGLGYAGKVKSPTYTLVELYEVSRLYLYHFDFYRLESSRDWIDAGFLEYFGGSAICLVEWPEKAAGTLPPADIDICLSLLAVPAAGRETLLTASSDVGRRCLSALAP
jgi:tRNA threonylcarbamoyladenosine biosynthesis protein TsaE